MIVVDWFEIALVGVGEHLVEPSLGFAGKQ